MKHQPLLMKKAAAAIPPGGTPEEIAQALADAGLLAWPAEEDPSRLPYGLWVRRTSVGVEVDTYPTVRALLKALAEEFVADPDGVAAEFAEIDAERGPGLDAVLDEMIERLGGSEIRYPATTARALAERIVRAAGPVLLPAQQDRRAG